MCDQLDCVRLLCHHGARPDLQDQAGAAALHYAVQADRPDLVTCLLESGADTDLRDRLGRTPAMWASSSSSLASLLLLLPRADLTARDGQSLTCLHSGAARGSVECVEALLDHQPDIRDIRDSDGASALFYAASGGQLDCVRLLVERSADVRLRDSLGRTVLSCALSSNNTQIMDTLKTAGADLLATTSQGDTILHLAIARQLIKMVSWILTNQPSVINRQNKAGVTPLHLASSLNQVRKVLSQSVDQTL